jgi:hypothetical protein
MARKEEDYFTKRARELRKLGKKMLVEKLIQMEQVGEWLDPDIRYFLDRVGVPVLVVRRDYHTFEGVLLGTKWDLAEIEIGCFDKRYDYNTGKYVYEKKVVKIPFNAIMDIEFIQEKKTEEEAKKEETVSQ